jgi:hypothetical protein
LGDFEAIGGHFEANFEAVDGFGTVPKSDVSVRHARSDFRHCGEYLGWVMAAASEVMFIFRPLGFRF